MVKERIKSLDVFRGAVMAAMILVENPGNWNGYAMLRHAAQGSPITPTDFIFPLFIFIMGAAVPLSLSKYRQGETAGSAVFIRIFRRTAVMFALGVFLRLYPHFQISQFILLGVLQRIATVYLITSILYLTLRTRTLLILVPVLLLGYWGMMTLIPVEGFTPPGFSRDHNIVKVVDQMVFGQFRPEGILSCIPAVVTGLLGVLTGIVLVSPKEKMAKFKLFMVAGAVTTALGLLWGTVFSIQKDLWTSSYTLYTGGVGILLFGLFYWVIDIKGWQKWTTPFLVYGLNCITVYFCAHLLAYSLWSFTGTMDGETVSLLEKVMSVTFNRWIENDQLASLLFSLSNVAIWYIPLYVLYRKKIIIKI